MGSLRHGDGFSAKQEIGPDPRSAQRPAQPHGQEFMQGERLRERRRKRWVMPVAMVAGE
jgi:hypothetical protein